MKALKNTGTAFLAAGLCLLLAGCGRDTKTDTAVTESATRRETAAATETEGDIIAEDSNNVTDGGLVNDVTNGTDDAGNASADNGSALDEVGEGVGEAGKGVIDGAEDIVDGLTDAGDGTTANTDTVNP